MQPHPQNDVGLRSTHSNQAIAAEPGIDSPALLESGGPHRLEVFVDSTLRLGRKAAAALSDLASLVNVLLD